MLLQIKIKPCTSTHLTGAVILLLQHTAAQVTVTLPQHEPCPATTTAALQTVSLSIHEVVVVDEAVRVGLDSTQPSLPNKPLLAIMNTTVHT